VETETVLDRVLKDAERTDSDIWRVDLDGVGQKAAIPVKFISSTKQEYFPAYSPDGERIALVPTRSGASEVRVCEGDGSNSAQLTSFGGASIYGPTSAPGCEETKVLDSVDLERGFGDAPEVVAETIRLVADAGLVGCTIEDATGNQEAPLYDSIRLHLSASNSLIQALLPLRIHAPCHNAMQDRHRS
jgi:hypothetical protein